LDGFKGALRERLAVGVEANRALSHEFRRLAATLIQAQGVQPLKTIMVTSAVPNEGKTLTALNLGLVLSESYRRRVLLIEADLRRPTIADLTNLSVADGLGDALRASDDRKVSLIAVTDRLTVLPAGRPDPDPLSGLTSARMQRLLAEAADQYEWVILDSPPVAAAADASLLCPLVDAAVLVVRANATNCEHVQQAVATLGHDRILGVILNGIEEADAPTYSHYPSPTDQVPPNA
jgi:receptor protein-tyrosine kinase